MLNRFSIPFRFSGADGCLRRFEASRQASASFQSATISQVSSGLKLSIYFTIASVAEPRFVS